MSLNEDSTDRQARLRTIIHSHVRSVARTLRNAGVPEADLDDEIQRTFIVASTRLDDMRPGAEKKFLLQVAINVAWHTRRRLARRREMLSDRLPERIDLVTPEHLTNRKQMRQVFEHVAESMHPSSRAVFMLHEFEGMTLKEIAVFLGSPVGTVASRLRRARDHFRNHVTAIALAADIGTKGVPQIDAPAAARRNRIAVLENALLGVGRSVPSLSSARTRTLAALGVS